MPSANGFALTVTTPAGGTFELVASWAAPYFVLFGLDSDNPKDRPLLYHAESFEDAQSFARPFGDLYIFNAQFQPVPHANGPKR